MRNMCAQRLEIEVERSGTYRKIEVRIKGRRVGIYEFTFLDNYRSCQSGVLYSAKTGAGIPRAMINKASQEIKHVAKRKGITIRHWGQVVSKDGEERLPHIFQELGYRRFPNRKRSGYSDLVKVYRP